jgi:hypothetical protein
MFTVIHYLQWKKNIYKNKEWTTQLAQKTELE